VDLITALRALWRGRLFVALAVVVSIALGIVVAYKVTPGVPPKLTSRQYTVALGTVNVLVDTPDSQVIDLSPSGADAVGTRASLLASLISTSPIKSAIAARVGIPADRLVVLGPQAGGGAAPPTGAAAAVTKNGRDAKIISIRTDSSLPVISIDTQGQTGEEATRLADGAAAGLQDYLKTVVKSQKVPRSRRLVLRQLGAPEIGISVRGPRKAYGAVLAIFLLTLSCAAIVIIPGIVRALRAAAEDEKVAKDAAENRRRAAADAAQRAEDEAGEAEHGPTAGPFTQVATPSWVRAIDADGTPLAVERRS
jgi:hypothetical protein